MTETTAEAANPTRPTVTSHPGDKALGVVRIVVGFMFACHGAQSIFGLFGGHRAEFAAWPSWWAGVIQLAGGLLLTVGLFTRVAALLNSGSMAYAYFTVHQAAALLPLQNKGEPAALYSWILLLFAFLGPGALALDGMRRQQSRRSSMTYRYVFSGPRSADDAKVSRQTM
ncbi:putative oxidoreductase [Amycolatopsis pretoriensis]|uniref:Putative oxidoreductase n=1 Tax=Amycolatopsis pretoriensis TaxID=218821 RepID=A0A1H5RIA6_9PSEU|nr:DoxX family protein [Amycolatopsis pretoriensis]SEF38059.1 putative oxidoreductase [Amycolatopsis pretoriensis]